MGYKYDRDFQYIFWYDTETTGLKEDEGVHPQILEHGYIITDLDFNEVERGEIYMKPRTDINPTPKAFAVTRLDIDKLERIGMTEYEGMRKIQNLMSKYPKTAISGYNTITYDDEIVRFSLYRNMLRPYDHENAFQNGNGRFDGYGLIQMVYAFKPDTLVWPVREDGTHSLKLEDLTEANGVTHSQAHSALSDVEATVALLKIVKDKEPELFHYYLWLSDKTNAQGLTNQHDVVFQTSTFFGKECKMTKPVYPMIADRTNKNAVRSRGPSNSHR